MLCCIGYLQYTHTHLNESGWKAAMYCGERSKGSQFSSGLAPLTQTAYELFEVHKSVSILVQKPEG